MTRLLLVDGSDLMGWLVGRLIPCNVEIVRAGTFAEAERCLRTQPPDAAIFNITPRHLNWRVLLDRCVRHEPSIPFLCCSAFEHDEQNDGPLPCRPEDYFTKSIPQDGFRTLLERLCADSRIRERDRSSRKGTRRGGPEDRTFDPTPA